MTPSPQELRGRVGAYRPRRLQRPELTRAAVLLPLCPVGEGYELFLIRRSEDLPRHAGQVACPGGICEPDDPDLCHTALRESHEEIGLEPGQVEVLGELDEIWTPSGYLLRPFVGLVAPTAEPQPCDPEVAAVLRIPLQELLDPAVFALEAREYEGVTYQVAAFNVVGEHVWGATGRMVQQLLQVAFDWQLPE